MKSSGRPAPTHFAESDTSQGRDLQWRISACLQARIPDIQGIHIAVFGNTVALRGEVRSLCEKRLCLECCRHVPGVMRLVDDLTVAIQPEFTGLAKLIGARPQQIEI